MSSLFNGSIFDNLKENNGSIGSKTNDDLAQEAKDREKMLEAQDKRYKEEIYGKQINRKWKIYFKLFDLNKKEDIIELERLHTEAVNSILEKEEGTAIMLEEVYQYLWKHKVLLKWGTWQDVNN